MKHGRFQVKDIADEVVLFAVRVTRGRHGAPSWSMLWDIEEVLSWLPKKVVRAKLANMIRRKILDGCACGCRGDFEEVPKIEMVASTSCEETITSCSICGTEQKILHYGNAEGYWPCSACKKMNYYRVSSG